MHLLYPVWLRSTYLAILKALFLVRWKIIFTIYVNWKLIFFENYQSSLTMSRKLIPEKKNKLLILFFLLFRESPRMLLLIQYKEEIQLMDAFRIYILIKESSKQIWKGYFDLYRLALGQVIFLLFVYCIFRLLLCWPMPFSVHFQGEMPKEMTLSMQDILT